MVNFIWIIACIAVTGLFLQIPISENTTIDKALMLMGICTTFMVGLSVVDAMRLRDLEKRLNKMDKIEKHLNELEKKMNIAFLVSWGVAYMKIQPYTSLLNFFKAFKTALKYKDSERANVCVKGMFKVLESIEKMSSEDKKDINTIDKNNFSKGLIKEIENEKLYGVFEDKILEIFKKLDKIDN